MFHRVVSFVSLFSPAAAADLFDYACEAVCEGVAECRSKGTYCKSWHTPQSCFGLYWSGGGKMCYQPGDVNCVAESPVLCVEVVPHAPPSLVESSTAPSTETVVTTAIGTTPSIVTTAVTTPAFVTTEIPTTSSDSSTAQMPTGTYEKEASTSYSASTLPTAMMELIPVSPDSFYDAVGSAAAVMADDDLPSSPRGRYCGLIEELVPISMYFADDTFDLAGISENDIEGIPYSLSASGCIIPDYKYPPFEDALGSTLGGNPFYVVFDRSKQEIRGTVAGGKIIATSC